MQLRIAACILAAIIALPGAALAQSSDRVPFFHRSDARAAIILALRTIHKAKCGGKPCEAATPEELASPTVDEDDARVALITGAKSARLKWCGLKWEERAFPAMMQEFQQRGVHNARTLTILGIIHNQQFGRDYANLQTLKTCSPEQRTALDEQIPVFDAPPWQRVLNAALLDSSVAHMLQRVLSQISMSQCGKGFCGPATDAEKANPPLTIEQARHVMNVGIMSGVAEFCGIDWKKRIFFPLMGYHNKVLKMSQRQLAIVAMLHGTMQGFILDNYREHEKSCPDQMKASVERQLTRN